MQNLRQIAANMCDIKNLIFAAVCSFLAVSAGYIYNEFQPSPFRFGLLIFIVLVIFLVINFYRLSYLMSRICQGRVLLLKNIKAYFSLSFYYLIVVCAAISIVVLELCFCALIKTDIFYFVVLAVFTSVLFGMFFFSFIGALELEYINSGYKFRELFEFKKLGKEYSSSKLARLTAVSVAEGGLCLFLLRFIPFFSNLFIQFFVVFIFTLFMLYLITLLEDYKLSVYKSEKL